MKTVTIQMTDLLSGLEVKRTIDSSNVMVADNSVFNFECNVLGNEEQQRKCLEKWISERGNEQHDTILELKSWTINN